jgi:molybdopterin synthase sulfur carrier subunit
MAIKILLFGQLKQLTGSSELELQDITDTDQLIKEMKSRFPEIRDLNYMIAVDKTIIHGNTSIHENQELALLPPYSGG